MAVATKDKIDVWQNNIMVSFQQIRQQFKNKDYQQVYFLHGAEAYYIDAISKYLERRVLNEAEKAFNQTILYGKETDAKTLIDTCYRYPMMAQHQVVILKEAQEMRNLKDVLPYVLQPVQTTILCICHKHKKLNLNSKFGRALKEHALVFESKKLYDNQIPDWINGHLRSRKLSIQPQAANLVAEYVGTDLAKVANELEKLVINLPAGTQVSPQHIEEHIGISKDYNIFELQRAIGQRNILKANRIVQYFTANPRKHPLVLVIGTMYNYFSKLLMLHAVQQQPESAILKTLGLRSAFFLREYRTAAQHFPRGKVVRVIGILKDFDLKSKGVDFNKTNTKDGELLKEMVWKILHT
ncbi:MAG: DNA polymerase III subunit delta [Bacteroidota bacterium]